MGCKFEGRTAMTATAEKYRPTGHPAVAIGKVGVLLVNLGTPEGTDRRSMRRYLKEFLSDRRVIEANPVLWWLILNGIILNTRPQRSGEAYEKIWNHELNESPLKTITRAQAEGLAARLADLGAVEVDWAMRYGEPATPDRIKALQARGCDRIVLFPLYPQYCAATTATALDKAYDALAAMRWQPAIRTVPPYYAEPAYIEALAQGIEAHLAGLAFRPDLILASFHGLPQAYFDKGDPYYCHCMKTARLLRARLGLGEDRLKVVFQSRFGKAEWLKPYAQGTVEALPGQGVRNLVMVMPGFAADCVETLEEVAIGLRDTFLARGGANFSAVPCLNASEGSVTMLETIVRRELAGWA
jgi:ferrochelatase